MRIVKSRDLIENGVAKPLPQYVETGINCYAYALGIMFPKIRTLGSYHPGDISGKPITDLSDVEKLKEAVCMDLGAINKQYRCVKVGEEVEVKNEYVIKLFYKKPINGKYGDFHFMRQDPETRKWFHKEGWFFPPEIVSRKFFEEDEIVNKEPVWYGDYSKEYDPICYWVIDEN